MIRNPLKYAAVLLSLNSPYKNIINDPNRNTNPNIVKTRKKLQK
jgi:hypothetical protein